MADKMQFDLVSPERKLASAEASMITIPGVEGDLSALPGHAPFLTTLRPGVVAVHDGGVEEYVVTGGFAEISPEGVSVLAEEALTKADVTSDWVNEKIAAAEKALEEVAEDGRAAAALRLNDFRGLPGLLGL
jgi:F-type H+-transporting ATPase subunit epsilon